MTSVITPSKSHKLIQDKVAAGSCEATLRTILPRVTPDQQQGARSPIDNAYHSWLPCTYNHKSRHRAKDL